jgi:hypothetical protein
MVKRRNKFEVLNKVLDIMKGSKTPTHTREISAAVIKPKNNNDTLNDVGYREYSNSVETGLIHSSKNWSMGVSRDEKDGSVCITLKEKQRLVYSTLFNSRITENQSRQKVLEDFCSWWDLTEGETGLFKTTMREDDSSRVVYVARTLIALIGQVRNQGG